MTVKDVTYSHDERDLYRFCLIMAPSLFALSTFFWKDGQYGVTGGTILVISFLFWIPVMMSLFNLVKPLMPRYAAWGMLLAFFGCIVGANFGFADIYSTVFGISHRDYLSGLALYPVSSNILLFSSGPLFPLNLLVLSIILLIKKRIPGWSAALLGLGAICFPLSRITRIDWLAHIVDMLFLVPLVYMAIIMRSEKKATGQYSLSR